MIPENLIRLHAEYGARLLENRAKTTFDNTLLVAWKTRNSRGIERRLSDAEFEAMHTD